jgi:hypothetical protein
VGFLTSNNLVGDNDIDSVPQKDFAVIFAVESKEIQRKPMETLQKTRAVTLWNYDPLQKLSGVCS